MLLNRNAKKIVLMEINTFLRVAKVFQIVLKSVCAAKSEEE